MGAAKRPADRGGPPNWDSSNFAAAPLPALPQNSRNAFQLQAQTRHVQLAPQVATAAEVAA